MWCHLESSCCCQKSRNDLDRRFWNDCRQVKDRDRLKQLSTKKYNYWDEVYLFCVFIVFLNSWGQFHHPLNSFCLCSLMLGIFALWHRVDCEFESNLYLILLILNLVQLLWWNEVLFYALWICDLLKNIV